MPHVSRTYEQSQHESHGEAEFNFGILYRTIEEHVERYAKEAGPAYSLADIADRVGELLRSKAKNVRAQYRAAELLSEMRENGTAASQGTRDRAGFETRSQVHVRARSGEALNGNRRSDYGRPHPGNEELHEKIRKMLAAGMSRNEIAEALKITVTALSYHVRSYNLDGGVPAVTSRKGPVPGTTKDEDKLNQITKLLNSGMSRAEVADKMGMTTDGVGYWIRTYKLEESNKVDVDTIGRRVHHPYTKKNPHWTQKPENRARVEKWMRKMKRMKKAKENA